MLRMEELDSPSCKHLDSAVEERRFSVALRRWETEGFSPSDATGPKGRPMVAFGTRP
jgi:hypothetical protein